jgi:hypothetical protein
MGEGGGALAGSNLDLDADIGLRAALSGVPGVVGVGLSGSGDISMETSSMGGSEKNENRWSRRILMSSVVPLSSSALFSLLSW